MIGAAALELAALGLPVVPLHNPLPGGGCSCRRADCNGSTGKHPRLDAWQSEATTDADRITSWWAHYPDANVGIVMGGAGRLVALDIDGPDGRASLGALEDKLGPLPRTRRSRSGRLDGGEHLLFKVPADLDLGAIKNSTGKVALGVDVRAHGGQIVAPPSMHASGRRYAWIDTSPIADLPAWLYDLMTYAPPSPVEPQCSAPAPSLAMRIKRASAYVAAMPPAIAGSGGHNATWNVAVALVRGFSLPTEVALEILSTEYNARCQPPWSARELRHKVDGAAGASLPDGYLIGDEGSGPAAAPRESAPGPAPAAPTRSDEDSEYEREERAGIADEQRGARKRLPTPAERIRALVNEGPILRLATGIPTLDEITRGGLMFGRCTAIGGAPDAGKTTLAVQIGHAAARAGIPTAIHCADVDDGEAIAGRVGQAAGLALSDLENRTPDTLERLASLLERDLPSLIIRDQDEDEVALEDTIAELVAAAAGRPAVLIGDSLQKLRTRLGADAENDQERIKATVSVLKTAAKRHRLLVLFPSELARGAYRSKKTAEQISDVSAFKHSGDIEHAIMVGLVMRNVEGETGLVDVSIAKNKRGRNSRPFRLRHDHARCVFEEVPMPDPEEARGEAHDGAVRAEVERVLREHRCASASAVADKAKKGRAAVLRMVKALRDSGAVVLVDGALRYAPPVQE